MYLQFREAFELPVEQVYPYFETPADWSRLYGSMGETRISKGGWHAVPLKGFPFPLVARNVVCRPLELVRWEFGGFWRGVGEVRFHDQGNQTVVEGFEYITAHGLWLLSKPFEELALRRPFERIWELGWRRLRKQEASS